MLGNQIKFFRTEKNVRQDELAEYLGVSSQAVSKWETGASDPDMALLPKIAIYFGISIDELFEMPYEEQMTRIENMFLSERRIEEKTFRRAEEYLTRVITGEPKDARALENLAYLYNHRAHSDHELASLYAQKVLELDPDSKGGWVAYLEANNGACGDKWYDNHFEVIRYFQEFLEKNPGNYSGLYAVIENLLADGRYDEALPYIQEIKKVKKSHQYLQYMGEVCYGKGEKEKALEYWNKMVTQHSDRWQAFCTLGDEYQMMGDLDKALEAFEKSYEMQTAPHIWDGLASMAQVHELLGDYDAAIKDYQRILKCLVDDYGIKEGEQIDSKKREIERLRKLKNK